MPKLNIEGVGEFAVDKGARLVLAIEDNDGDINHACGEYRLSCQCLVDGDMSVIVLDRFSVSGRPDPGSRPDNNITPSAEWVIP